jgi:hypothetical protein
MSQLGRALRELGVELMPAHSPQVKGRSERLLYTLHDRLVQEMRMAGSAPLADAIGSCRSGWRGPIGVVPFARRTQPTGIVSSPPGSRCGWCSP